MEDSRDSKDTVYSEKDKLGSYIHILYTVLQSTRIRIQSYRLMYTDVQYCHIIKLDIAQIVHVVNVDTVSCMCCAHPLAASVQLDVSPAPTGAPASLVGARTTVRCSRALSPQLSVGVATALISTSPPQSRSSLAYRRMRRRERPLRPQCEVLCERPPHVAPPCSHVLFAGPAKRSAFIIFVHAAAKVPTKSELSSANS